MGGGVVSKKSLFDSAATKMAFINRRKRIDPKTDPCLTPDRIRERMNIPWPISIVC